MSKLYDDSLKNYKFFSKQSVIERTLTAYSLTNDKIIKRTVANYEQVGGGVPISYDESKKLVFVDSSDSHSMIIGSTGSKKSRLIAMPMIRTLIAAKETMIIADPKGELFDSSSELLQKSDYDIIVINLRTPDASHCWNPLATPYEFYCNNNIDKACELVNDIATNLIAMNKSSSDPFWDNSASALFFGLTLLLFKYCNEFKLPIEDVHLGNVFSLRTHLFSSRLGQNGSDFNLNIDPDLEKFYEDDIIIQVALIGTTHCADQTKVSILSTFDQKMRMFSMQPNLRNMLAHNEVDMEGFIKKPTACFLIVPDEKTTYHQLVSLFIKQSYELLLNSIHNVKSNKEHQLRVNYILDEFSSLPTIADFPAMVTAARSRKIRFNIFVQSKHQLQKRYGEEVGTIQDNCTNWIFLASREMSMLNEISSLCGTEYRANGSSKPIVAIEDLQRLDKKSGETLILSGRNRPYISKLPDIDMYTAKKGIARITFSERIVKELLKFDFPIKRVRV